MRFRPSWPLVLLGLAAAAAAVAAVLELGPPPSSARTAREVLTASQGVVESTVTGTGNVEPGTDAEAAFQTSGTLQHLYVRTGDHVIKGQLLATLDPTAAQSTLDQAEENLTAAEDQVTNAEETTITTTTTPAAPTTTSAPTATTLSRSSSGSSGTSSSGGSSAQSSGVTAATKAANIATAEGSVDGAEADVTNAETALHESHLYSPATGTVVSVQDISPGDQISGSSVASSPASSAGASAGTGTTSAGGLGSSGNSSSSSSSSSSGLAEIVDTARMTMTVAFSESDISKIKTGQPATVTLDALTGVELGAHVTSISTLGTTSSSVVSYDATLTLDQRDSRVKPGMSASAAVITGQASGVTLPTSAVATRGSTSTVNLLRDGKTVSRPVTVGVQGDSRTQIVSGLRAGDQVVITQTLPSLGASGSTASSGAGGTLGGASGRLGGFPGAGAGGVAGGAGTGGGFARRFGGG